MKTIPTILMVGQDVALEYLLGRFAERSGYRVAVSRDDLSFEDIEAANPAAIIFLSPELLETTQSLVGQLTNMDTPILVCSSPADEARARELGADHCLQHPLTLDDFQTALTDTLRRA